MKINEIFLCQKTTQFYTLKQFTLFKTKKECDYSHSSNEYLHPQ